MSWRGIGELCRQFGLAHIVDEVFADYGRGADGHRVRCAAESRDSLTFVLNGFSKIVGLPQLKLAWIHVSGPDALCRQAREHLEFINDAYLTVATPIQNAAADILRQRGMIQAQICARVETNGSTLETGNGNRALLPHTQAGGRLVRGAAPAG